MLLMSDGTAKLADLVSLLKDCVPLRECNPLHAYIRREHTAGAVCVVECFLHHEHEHGMQCIGFGIDVVYHWITLQQPLTPFPSPMLAGLHRGHGRERLCRGLLWYARLHRARGMGVWHREKQNSVRRASGLVEHGSFYL